MSKIIKVPLTQKHHYNIHVGLSLEAEILNFFTERYSSRLAVVIIDEKVHQLHKIRIESFCSSYFSDVQLLVVPEGETSKSLGQWSELVDGILKRGVERNTPLIAVGGGVTGDLAGFVAASVLRGLPLVHMPTSLLAMVDSSIGGKTGVNHDAGKNLIGSFYQPDAVFADISFLETLEKKEWITGLAEILKYAAIQEPSLFQKLEKLVVDGFTPAKGWAEVISQSARIKVNVVQKDTLEKGTRAYLNFGHTFGHALERTAGYGLISHGEAVFVGMMAATYFSRQMGHPVDEARFASFLPLYQKQIEQLPNSSGSLIEAMKTDKKVIDNLLRLVLLKEWGSPYIYECEDPSILHEVWQTVINTFNS